jgi:hypothetical protein
VWEGVYGCLLCGVIRRPRFFESRERRYRVLVEVFRFVFCDLYISSCSLHVSIGRPIVPGLEFVWFGSCHITSHECILSTLLLLMPFRHQSSRFSNRYVPLLPSHFLPAGLNISLSVLFFLILLFLFTRLGPPRLIRILTPITIAEPSTKIFIIVVSGTFLAHRKFFAIPFRLFL